MLNMQSSLKEIVLWSVWMCMAFAGNIKCPYPNAYR